MVSAQADSDRRLGYEDISCNGSVMIFDSRRDLLSVVRDFMQFFVDESCGICVPCRVGNVALRDKVDLVIRGRASSADLDDMTRWGTVVAATSRCGLGATSPNPILTTMAKFPGAFTGALRAEDDDGLLPSFDVHAALNGYAAAVNQLARQESR
jgi:[NiFe] hydrogenase diaphorase moiety large subunit